MYTREEAIEKVLEMKKKLGHIPSEDEYREEKVLSDLMYALRVKSYAAVNITVLRELRKRRGENPYIARDSDERWCADVIFAPNSNPRKRFLEENNQARVTKTPEAGGETRPRKKKWGKKAVAEIVMRFYEQYGRFPTGTDFYQGGAFKNMDGNAPSCWVLYSNLGEHRSSWLKACAEILEIPPEELPEKAKRTRRKKSTETHNE